MSHRVGVRVSADGARQQTLGSGLVPLVNRLQDIFASAGVRGAKGIDLPQIAVVDRSRAGNRAFWRRWCVFRSIRDVGCDAGMDGWTDGGKKMN